MRKLILVMMFITFPSVPMHPTTIAVVARNGSIYVGADGIREAPGGKPNAVCKLKKYGTVLITHYGAANVDLQANLAHSWTSIDRFSADDIEQMAGRVPGSLSDKADWLERYYWSVYQKWVYRALRFQPGKLRDGIEDEFGLTGFVLAGKGVDGMPEAIVLQFTTDFRESNPKPVKMRWKIPQDKTVSFLGLADYHIDSKVDPFASGISKGIISYLKLETQIRPGQVGAPYAVVRIDKDRMVFEQQGACNK
jgi:hypothetical protein